MVAKTVKYKDFLGNEREETVRFNLTKTEVMELSMSVNGGLDRMIKRITEAQDGATIMQVFKEILLKSYGEISLDGRQFVKSKELSEAFSQTPMYDSIFQELVMDAEKAAAFFRAVAPKIEGNSNDEKPSNPSRGAIADFVPGPLPTEKPSIIEPLTPAGPQFVYDNPAY